MGEKATKEIAKLEAGHKVAPIVPRNVDEAFRLAQAVLAAGLAPDSYDNDPQKIMMGILKGSEVGLPPITALSTICIINKRPSIYGDGAVALVQASGELESIREWFEGDKDQDDWTAVCEIKRRGQDEIYTGRFSVSDAKRAKLWMNPKKGPWMQYPQRMLKMRARSWPLRDAFADCLSGLSIAEEAQDIPAAPEIVDKGFLEDAPQIEMEPPAQYEDPAPPPPWAAFTDKAVDAMQSSQSMEEIQNFHGEHLQDIEALPDMAREMYDRAKSEAVQRLSEPQEST